MKRGRADSGSGVAYDGPTRGVWGEPEPQTILMHFALTKKPFL